MNTVIKAKQCYKDVEFLSVQCRPFYLPREITCVVIINLYIPPDADSSTAAAIISEHVNVMQTLKPNADVIILGDFNMCVLRNHLPKFYQMVSCSTRQENILDLFYCNMKNSYVSKKLPPIGNSDHNMIQMIPVYKQQLKTVRPVIKQIQSCNQETVEELRACLQWTNWEVF